MVKINDYALEAMKNRQSPEGLANFMKKQDLESIKRAEITKWKRFKNRIGGTGKILNFCISRKSLNCFSITNVLQY